MEGRPIRRVLSLTVTAIYLATVLPLSSSGLPEDSSEQLSNVSYATLLQARFT